MRAVEAMILSLRLFVVFLFAGGSAFPTASLAAAADNMAGSLMTDAAYFNCQESYVFIRGRGVYALGSVSGDGCLTAKGPGLLGSTFGRRVRLKLTVLALQKMHEEVTKMLELASSVSNSGGHRSVEVRIGEAALTNESIFAAKRCWVSPSYIAS